MEGVNSTAMYREGVNNTANIREQLPTTNQNRDGVNSTAKIIYIEDNSAANKYIREEFNSIANTIQKELILQEI